MRIARFNVRVWHNDGSCTFHTINARDRRDVENKIYRKQVCGTDVASFEILSATSHDRRRVA